MAKQGSKGGGSHGKDVTVGPHKGDDRWAVTRQGNERASRVTDTKKEAVGIGRGYAKEEHSELIVKDAGGKIQSKDSHGHDPKKSKG
jgi:hypothetical protein